MVSNERGTRQRIPKGIAKIELLLTGKLRDSSAPQSILASLANSILFASWEETAVHAVTESLDVITNFNWFRENLQHKKIHVNDSLR